jgi:hypothetical protein
MMWFIGCPVGASWSRDDGSGQVLSTPYPTTAFMDAQEDPTQPELFYGSYIK